MWDWLTHDLRYLCKKYDLSVAEFGRMLGRSSSGASNILAGRRFIRDQDADIIDERYDTGGHHRRLLGWARRSHDTEWFGQYLVYEVQALVIKAFEALTVPGLLQTPEYAHALLKGGFEVDIDTEVTERMERQKILTKPSPPLLWFLVAENVLEWPIGGRDVMKAQLAYLLEVSELPNVGIRVVEKTVGSHPGLAGSFSVISGEFGDIAYTESPGAGRLVLSSIEVRSYEAQYDHIGQVASPESISRDIIRRAMEAL